MKRITLTAGIVVACLAAASCCRDGKCCGAGKEAVEEGRISTHTTRTHAVHQEITAEEAEMAKDHITHATAPGVSTVSIDAEGARIINESRGK